MKNQTIEDLEFQTNKVLHYSTEHYKPHQYFQLLNDKINIVLWENETHKLCIK